MPVPEAPIQSESIFDALGKSLIIKNIFGVPNEKWQIEYMNGIKEGEEKYERAKKGTQVESATPHNIDKKEAIRLLGIQAGMLKKEEGGDLTLLKAAIQLVIEKSREKSRRHVSGVAEHLEKFLEDHERSFEVLPRDTDTELARDIFRQIDDNIKTLTLEQSTAFNNAYEHQIDMADTNAMRQAGEEIKANPFTLLGGYVAELKNGASPENINNVKWAIDNVMQKLSESHSLAEEFLRLKDTASPKNLDDKRKYILSKIQNLNDVITRFKTLPSRNEGENKHLEEIEKAVQVMTTMKGFIELLVDKATLFEKAKLTTTPLPPAVANPR